MKKVDHTFIKDSNKSLILNVIREKQPVSRTQLLLETGLAWATISKFTNELINDGFVKEVDTGSTSIGRSPKHLVLQEDVLRICGISITSRHYDIVLVNLKGVILNYIRRQIDTTLRTPKSILKEVIENTADLIKGENVIGVGVSFPALVNSEEGKIVSCKNLPGWDGFDIAARLEKKLKIPTLLQRNAISMLLGERYFGAAADSGNVILVHIGYGISASILIDNKIITTGNIGELGHVIVDENGPECRCGRKGCLEAIASLFVLEKQFQEEFNAKPPARIYKKIIESGKKGDERVVEAFEKMAKDIGRIIANIITFLNADKIILCGDILEAGDLFMNPFRQVIEARVLNLLIREVTIVPSTMGEHIAALGAAALVFDRYCYNVPVIGKE